MATEVFINSFSLSMKFTRLLTPFPYFEKRDFFLHTSKAISAMEERLIVDNQMDGYKQNVVKLRENILNNNIEKFLWNFFIKTLLDYVCFVFDKKE